MPLPQLVSRSAFFQTLIVMVLLGASVPANAGHSQLLVSNPRSLGFGKVITGQSQSQSATLINNTSSTVTVSAVSVNVAVFTVSNFIPPVTLAAGQSASFTVTFLPTGIGSASGAVTFTSNAPNSTLNVPVSGKGVNNWALQASPSSLAFGNVAVGGYSTLPMTIINAGSSTATISIGRVGGLGYSVSGVKLPLNLDAGQSFTFSVTFAPTAAGVSLGSLLATSPLYPLLTIPLSGTGVAAGTLSVTPTAIDFGNVVVGQGASQGGQLTASTSDVTVSTATMSNPAFVLSGLSLPMTIAAGQSVPFTVTFTPQSSGQVSGTLSFGSNAANSPTVESLTGTGNPVQHHVDLSWDPSVSQVAGYNVYRSLQMGGPYSRLNSSLDSNTAFTDGTVQGGNTYYYATTAVDSNGEESAYSNLAPAVIP